MPDTQPIVVGPNCDQRLVDTRYAITVWNGNTKVAAAWGPAADGTEWFVAVPGSDPRRVADRDAGQAAMVRVLSDIQAAARPRLTGADNG